MCRYADDLTDDEVEKPGRDPFLIAYAMSDIESRTVVTTEVSSTDTDSLNTYIPGFWLDRQRTIEYSDTRIYDQRTL